MVSFSNYPFLHHDFEKNKKGDHLENEREGERETENAWWKFMFIKFKTSDAIDAVLLLLLSSFVAFIRSSERMGILLLDCVQWCDALTCFINIHIPTVSSRYVCTYTISTLFDLLR